MSLFSNNPIPIFLDLPDAEIIYYPHFFTTAEAQAIYQKLLEKTPWQQDPIKVFGKTHLQPRLTALFGNEDKSYSYSNIKMQPHPWNPLLRKINLRLETEIKHTFTSVLLNLYRDGKDSNGWHSDNEKELGTNPIIASLSFGAERSFHLQHQTQKNLKHKIILEHGSLLIMKGTTQTYWKHQIPKTTKPIGARINLTFRTLF